MKHKFKIGDEVVIAPKYRSRYNYMTTTGTVTNIFAYANRTKYRVKFQGKNFECAYYSYELEAAPSDKNQLKKPEAPKNKPIIFVSFRPQDEVETPVFKTGDRVLLTVDAVKWLKEYDARRVFDPKDYVKAHTVTRISSREYKGRQRIAYNLDCKNDIFFLKEDLIPSKADNLEARSSREAKQENKKDNLSRMKSCWNQLCNLYLAEFCRRHGFRYDTDMWVSSNPGTTIEVCDMFVSMEDIRYDVDNQINPEWFQKWYWKSIEVYELTNGRESYLNYPSYCKGAPDPYTEEKMSRLRAAHKRLREAEESLKAEIDTFISSKKLF